MRWNVARGTAEPRGFRRFGRSFPVLVLILGSLLSGGLILGSRTAAEATPVVRTREQVLHMELVIDNKRRALAEGLELAVRYGRGIHLDQAAEAARVGLPMTIATDPYTHAEAEHLRKALQALEQFSGGSGSGQGRGERPSHRHVRTALESLDWVFTSLHRAERGAP